MTPELWRQLEFVFQQAAGMSSKEQADYVNRIATENPDLGRQLKELLEADAAPAPFDALKSRIAGVINAPASYVEGDCLLGRFQIVRLLGSGGMGSVYEAQDSHLGPVALKTLARELTADGRVLAQLRKEVQLARRVSDPHVCRIHELFVSDDVSLKGHRAFVTMELLEGVTLSTEIRRRGRLPWPEALKIMIEVCHGLRSIHGAGVVHRDLKAANIMLAVRNGSTSAVLMDFGIACTFGTRKLGSGTEQTETLTIVGTPDYMAPEQFEGKSGTPATDIYALGVILYEITTGRSPFVASSAVGAAVARGRAYARASSLVPELPARCDAIISKCLEYDPFKRFQSVDELLEALERRGPLLTIGKRRPRSYSFYWGVAAVLLVVLSALLWRWPWHSPPSPPEFVQLTHDGLPKLVGGTDGSRLYIFGGHGLFSPGGRPGEVTEMSVDGNEAQTLPPLPAHMFPSSLSPNGLELLLVEGQGLPHRGPLWIMTVLGRSLRRLGKTEGQDGAWSPDGKMIAYGDGSNLMVAKADGAEPRRVTHVNDSDYLVSPVWSPDQRHLRFTRLNGNAHTSSIWEVTLDGKNLHRLLTGWQKSGDSGGHWTADGKYFVFQAGRQIWALPRAGAVPGLQAKPIRLTFSPMSLFDPVPSKDGKKLFCIGSTTRGELDRYDMKLGRFSPYLGGISAEYVAFSRNGQWVAYVSFPEGTLWRSKVDGSERLQLTFPPSNAVLPRWSPDGKKILFFQDPPDKAAKLFTIPFEGGTPQPLLPDSPEPQRSPTWSPEGNQIAFGGNRDRQSFIRILDLVSSKVTTLTGSRGLYSPRWSPDGRYLAALSYDVRRVMLFDFHTQQWRKLADGTLNWPCWSHDSHSLYLLDINQADVVRIRLSDGKPKRVTDLTDFAITGNLGAALALTPDDSPLLLRDAGNYDVYERDWNLR